MRMGQIRLSLLFGVYLFVLVLFVGKEVQAQQACTPIAALKIRTAASMFDVEQERILGDVEALFVEQSYPVVHDDEFAAHLNTVLRRILPLLPPKQMPVHFILIDTPEPESFSVGPERIYLSRKMIGLLKNDDELAGLLAHEVGHILMHQNALMVSQLFHEILGVNRITGREDISDNMARLFGTMDRSRKMLQKAAHVIERQEGTGQFEADRAALYISAAAGFSPKAFLELFERSAATTGSAGNPMTDFFAATTSNKRRLREINKTLRQLPRPCREIAAVPSGEFLTWQAAILSYSDRAAQ